MDIYRLRINGLFYQYSVDVDLRNKANVLIGANGVGKTTILQIINCLKDNDFLTLSRWSFISMEVYLRNKTGRALKKPFLFKQEELFPDEAVLIEGFAKYKHTQGLLEENLFDVKYDKHVEVLLNILKESGQYYNYLSQSILDVPYSKTIKEYVNYAAPGCYETLSELGQFVRTLIESPDKTGGIRLINGSLLYEKIIFNDKKRTIYDSICTKGDKNIFYFDLVKSVSFIESEYPEPICTSPILRWINGLSEIRNEDDISEHISSYDFGEYIFSPLPLLGISYSVGDVDKQVGGEISSLIFKLYKDVHDFRLDPNTVTKVMRQISESQPIDLNGLISNNYFESEYVDRINRMASDFAAEIMSGQYTDFRDEVYIEMEDYEKYSEINVIEETPMELDFIEKHKDIIDNLDSIEDEQIICMSRYLKDPKNRAIITNYIMPIIAKESIFSPSKLFQNEQEYEDDWGDEYDAMVFRDYMFYKRIIDDIQAPIHKSKTISKLEEMLSKYLYDKEISIFPSGIFFYKKNVSEESNNIERLYKTSNGAIGLNELASGEKKIVLLLCIALLCKNFTILIDEPELSLSIVWQSEILKDIVSEGVLSNITVATHSPYLVEKEELEPYIIYLPSEEESDGRL